MSRDAYEYTQFKNYRIWQVFSLLFYLGYLVVSYFFNIFENREIAQLVTIIGFFGLSLYQHHIRYRVSNSNYWFNWLMADSAAVVILVFIFWLLGYPPALIFN